MAGRTLVATTSVNRSALTAVPAPGTAPDVANGNFCLNDGATVLILLNGDSSPHTLTVQPASGVDGLTAGPKTYPVPVSGIRQWTGVFPIQFYGSQLTFNLDSALVTVQAVSLLGP
jgi:hypothetical protein